MGVISPKEYKVIAPQMNSFTTYNIWQILNYKDRLSLITEEYGLTKVQFGAVIQCNETEAENFFKIFDREGKGKIDATEFFSALFLVCQAPLTKKAEMIFRLHDLDGNLFLLKDELTILLLSVFSALAHMVNAPLPKVNEMENIATSMISPGDKGISLIDFLRCTTKNKDLLNSLSAYDMITKDDIRLTFCNPSEDQLEFDSDLENEIYRKGKEKLSINYDLLQHPLINKFSLIAKNAIKAKRSEEISLISCAVPSDLTHNLKADSKNDSMDLEAPDANLELEYIHGYRTIDTRNNLRYNKEGDIVYHAASVGIVLNQGLNTQHYFFEHLSEIVCLAMHPNMIYAATGDVSPTPKICIWDTITMECIARITGLLNQGISHICFSPDGNYLAASATDEYHCIVIYDWEKCTTTSKNVANKSKKSSSEGLVGTGQVTSASVLSLLFNPSGDQVIAPAVNELNFISFSGGAISVQKGECQETNPNKQRIDKQALLCAAYIGTALVTGCFDGKLIIWKGRNLSHYIRAHKGPVNAIWGRPNATGIITGGNDGIVKVWDQSLKPIKIINIGADSSICSMDPKIRSICEKSDGNILIGTRSGDIVEITKNIPKVLIRSHYRNELWGLDINPKKPEYVTLDNNCMLGVWDIVTRKQRLMKKLNCGGNTVTYSGDGMIVAVGLLNGQIEIFDSNFKIVATRKDTSSRILVLKFSPNDKIMLSSVSDSRLYLYDTTKNFKLISKYRAPGSIRYLDFSEDSEFIQVNTMSMQYLCFVLEKEKTKSLTEPIVWETYTCPTGTLISGVHEPNTFRDSINTVARLKDKTLLATGDRNGFIKLFKFPCLAQNTSYRLYKGHARVVSNIKFTMNGDYLISIGAVDKTIFQWKFKKDSVAAITNYDLFVDEVLKSDVRIESSSTSTLKLPSESEASSKSVNSENEANESGKKRKLISDILHSKPKNFKVSRTAADMPDANIAIKYVHGYRSYDTRNNAKWTKHDEILYHTGALGIVLNLETNTQSFFVQHEKDIVSLAIHPNNMIAATGELVEDEGFPAIYIWNVETKDILARLKGFHTKAIRHLKFSPNGSKLLSIGEDINHSFALYDWMSNQIITSSAICRNQITGCDFKSEYEFAVCSVNSLKIWSINGYNSLSSNGALTKPEPLTTITFAFSNKECVVGSALGNIIIWEGQIANEPVAGHKGKISSMLAKSSMLITAGEDGFIIVWNNALTKVSMIDVNKIINRNCIIRALGISNLGVYLVGTADSEIITINQNEYEMWVNGHSKGELWGLCTSPSQDEFITCGGDREVCLWNPTKLIFKKEFTEEARACDWAGNGQYVVIGFVGGKIINIDPENNLDVISEIQSSFKKGSWIPDIKIAPNCQVIAFGGAPNPSHLELVKTQESGANLQHMRVIDIGLKGALIHLDWDSTSNNLVTNSSNFELVYVNAATSSVVKATVCADNNWHTWTSIFGFSVKGLSFTDSINVNTVCRSSNGKVLAVGDDYAKIKLFKYPYVDSNATCKVYIGHSSRIAKVAFIGDRYLVSIGCTDRAIIVWELSLDISSEVEEAVHNESYSEAEDEDAIPKEGDFVGRQEVDGIVGPSDFIKLSDMQSQAPRVNLTLKYAYGYKGKNCRNNVAYLKDGCIAYNTAALGIVQNVENNTQRFFNWHTGEIVAVAFHPDGIKVATGERRAMPSIYIWDSTTCNKIVSFEGQLEVGVKCLSYSYTGDYLVAIDMSPYHVLAVYDTNNAILLAMSKTDRAEILDIAFQEENILITVGVKHYMFWKISNKCLTSRKGIFGENNDILGCVAAQRGLLLTGNKLGELYNWNDIIIESTLKVHFKPIDSIIIAEQMYYLLIY